MPMPDSIEVPEHSLAPKHRILSPFHALKPPRDRGGFQFTGACAKSLEEILQELRGRRELHARRQAAAQRLDMGGGAAALGRAVLISLVPRNTSWASPTASVG